MTSEHEAKMNFPLKPIGISNTSIVDYVLKSF